MSYTPEPLSTAIILTSGYTPPALSVSIILGAEATPDALEGSTAGLAQSAASLTGKGTVAGAASGSATAEATGRGLSLIAPVILDQGRSRRRRRPVRARPGLLAGAAQGAAWASGILTGEIVSRPIRGQAHGGAVTTADLVGRVTRGVLAARSIGRAVPVAHGRRVEDDEMLFLLLAA